MRCSAAQRDGRNERRARSVKLAVQQGMSGRAPGSKAPPAGDAHFLCSPRSRERREFIVHRLDQRRMMASMASSSCGSVGSSARQPASSAAASIVGARDSLSQRASQRQDQAS